MPVKKPKSKEAKNSKKTDWSKGRWKEMLIQQRKFMWKPEMVKLYADWLGLRQGMTAVDVGCGLGFLGYTYWPHFGRKGKYVGIDQSTKLLIEAETAAKQWARGGKAEFLTGDAYNLPFKDNFADWVMCQTLLMHLEHPEGALKEMLRMLKPGGLFMCNEPDNLSGTLAQPFFTGPRLKIEEKLLFTKLQLCCHEGRIKLGRGDESIGNKIPHLLAGLGMKEIDIRMNDKVWFIEPPYESEEQQHRLKMFKKNASDRSERHFWMKRMKEEFLEGGGNEREFTRARKIMNRFRASIRKRLKNDTLASCGGGFFYIIKARKPK